MMSSIILKPGREKSLLRRHPWIFSGAVARLDGNPVSGETVDLLAANGQFLARAAYSPVSQIRARTWTFDPAEQVDQDFFRRRLQRAILARASLPSSFSALENGKGPGVLPPVMGSLHPDMGVGRLVYAELDGLPGLIVDRYAGTLVLQSLTAGSEYWKEALADLLVELTGLKDIYERSDADVRELEGLSLRVGALRGVPPPNPITILENDLKFNVNIETGHKTGFYLDQRLNRLRVRALAAGRDVLDCFCYTGGFSLNALAGAARSVLSVDASAEALAMCRDNVALNGFPADRHKHLEGDVFQLLRKFRDEGKSFDMVILDPPKFAPGAAQVEKAARGYKDINLLAFKLLRPGGLLVTFSCSGGVDAALFQKIIAAAALDAGVDAQILEYLSQGPDHPVGLNFPEGAYLKGLICRKIQ